MATQVDFFLKRKRFSDSRNSILFLDQVYFPKMLPEFSEFDDAFDFIIERTKGNYGHQISFLVLCVYTFYLILLLTANRNQFFFSFSFFIRLVNVCMYLHVWYVCIWLKCFYFMKIFYEIRKYHHLFVIHITIFHHFFFLFFSFLLQQ